MGCFGGDKTTVVQGGSTTQTVTPTAEEQEMQKLQLDQYKQTQPYQTEVQKTGLDLINKILGGGISELPGFFQELGQGISPETIGTEASRLAGRYMPGFQSLGLSDSGTAYKETARGIANELLYPSEQFNIGARQNLLNLALSGQAQVQAPVQSSTNTLASSLAGLRSTTGTYTSNQTTTGMNPFLRSFQTSLGSSMGSTLGGGNISKGSGWFGI